MSQCLKDISCHFPVTEKKKYLQFHNSMVFLWLQPIVLASFPSHPTFRHLKHTASDRKLGKGLGMRLPQYSIAKL